MTRIEQIIDQVIATEGGYSNDPDDAGGETNFGITVAVARENGYSGPMKAMPRDVAVTIYTRRYVQEPRFDGIAALDGDIGAELIDTGVNMGPAQAAIFLQRWLNGLNDTGSRYQTLFVDGRLGNVSMAALAAYLKWRGADGKKVLLRALNSAQALRYLEIAENKTSQKKYLYGWILNRVEMA